MDNLIITLPKEFYELELSMINNKLNKLKNISSGYHSKSGTPYRVLRVKLKGQNKWKEIQFDRAPEEYKKLATRKDLLMSRKAKIKAIMQSQTIDSRTWSVKKVNSVMDGDFFAKAKDQCIPPDTKSNYTDGHYQMRSRAEVLISTYLKNLGLEYKYEVKIPGLEDAVDFLIYIPCLDCCFILEYFGRLGDYKYSSKTTSKLITEFQSNLRIFYEYAFLGGNENYVPSEQEVINLIGLVILNLCQERIVYEQVDT